MLSWKKLGECCNLEKGATPIQKAIPGEYPLVVTSPIRRSCNTYQFDKPSVCVPLVSSRGHGVASLNQVFYQEGKFALGNILCSVTPYESDLNARYLYYYLNTFKDSKIVPLMTGGANVSLTVKKLSTVRICYPSLFEQERIVSILDTFTSSISNLKEQIKERRKQYEYYRDQLLDLEGKEGVEMKTLGEVCEIGDGIHGTPTYNDFGEYYFINGNNLNCGRILIKPDTKKVDGIMFEKYGIAFDETTLFLSINGTIGNIALYAGEKILLGKSAAYFKNINVGIIMKQYLYHYLQSNYAKNYYNNSLTGSTIKNLGLKALRTFSIPIPPKQTQSRIVTILDQFEASIANLEAQLKEREKQYEYYRNQLLTLE